MWSGKSEEGFAGERGGVHAPPRRVYRQRRPITTTSRVELMEHSDVRQTRDGAGAGGRALEFEREIGERVVVADTHMMEQAEVEITFLKATLTDYRSHQRIQALLCCDVESKGCRFAFTRLFSTFSLRATSCRSQRTDSTCRPAVRYNELVR